MTTLARTALLGFSLLLVACGSEDADSQAGSGGMAGGAVPDDAAVASYQQTPEAVASGERIFEAQACIRCHKPAGETPGLGPSLWDTEWVYGGEPQQIFESIMHGRPKGMAPYQGRLSHQEVWHLVAFLRSASGTATP
jgi:mono/diheme cytochrome c family protein